MSSHRIRPVAILCIWGHSASMSLEKGEVEDEESNIGRRVSHEALSIWVVYT